MSRVDNKIDDSYAFLPVMESSDENVEDIPKTLSVAKKVKSTKMFIGLQLFELYS